MNVYKHKSGLIIVLSPSLNSVTDNINVNGIQGNESCRCLRKFWNYLIYFKFGVCIFQ